ncbi:WD repeat domain phosphoinositide-interacting protein 2 [Caerostris extrusa]|uniref:WD repeat domain phosphoinositide-interacting protein 2 n=1 Tax=Caerostris extrusa TaxID=172846 RepID=A0AAV4V9Q4_CAEEX|nr:WD repeat domain phosphoinositide-interacting protein 2 [Caerostris extrusa]
MSESGASNDILYVNFNQIATALAIGTKTGYTLYDINTVHECIPTADSMDSIKDVCIVERNFATGLIAFVELDKPRTLVMLNQPKRILITEKSFSNTILSVKINRTNVVVCLEDTIYIFDVTRMADDTTLVITNTPPNLKGLTALSYSVEKKISFLAYPGSSTIGTVQIFDAINKRAKLTIPAHDNPLAALAFNESADKIATASIKGTVIRVFSVSKGEILYEFRRGVKRCVDINCLSFFSLSKPEMLCVSSNTETIHIFKLTEDEVPQQLEEEPEEGWMEMFGRVLSKSAQYLPSRVSGCLTQQRSFAYVHLPFVSQSTICAISFIHTTPYILVCSLEGFLYIYSIDMDVGGLCQLMKQHKLEGPPAIRQNYPQRWEYNPDSKDELPEKKAVENPDKDSTAVLEKVVDKSCEAATESKQQYAIVPALNLSNGFEDNFVSQVNASNDDHSSEDYLSAVNDTYDSDLLPPVLTQIEL